MSSNSPRTNRGASRRPNKAQQRANQVRAAQTVAQPSVISQRVAEAPTSVAPASPSLTRERATRHPRMRQPVGQPRVVARPVGLTREQEYAAIKADLVRLLITFGVLMVVMVALLFVIEQ